jgi:hypothetical protein
MGQLLGHVPPVTESVLKTLFFLVLLALVFGLPPIIARNINPDAMKGCEDTHSLIYCFIADWDSRRN